ncbi:tRNA (adenine(37)-N6)-methyltransferase-like isoform X2 [Ornithodoros turicata]|uniref:tRNA (adenine(37)-N6)-methyltransferase-like isoform X2 n=1 Tax=Ornithodoros turicata TaxID=34597 RepID=UPI003139E4F9
MSTAIETCTTLQHLEALTQQISVSRREIANIRKSVHQIKAQFKDHCEEVKKILELFNNPDQCSLVLGNKGRIRTPFTNKNATPRQASVCEDCMATLTVDKAIFNNPQHSLENLDEFSHIWLLFVFDRNKRIADGSFSYKSKVCPPRLNGASVGLFSTRSPHRPCPIGLSLVRLIKIEGDTVYISGVDLVDGTPILDIKPYIPDYDVPRDIFSTPPDIKDVGQKKDSDTVQQNVAPDGGGEASSAAESPSVTASKWISEIRPLTVGFTESAQKGLGQFHGSDVTHPEDCAFCLHHFQHVDRARNALINLLSADPRSVYRKKHCADRLYYCVIDTIHVTAWFDDFDNRVEVLKVSSLPA